MATEIEERTEVTAFDLSLTPLAIDAGVPATLTARLACTPATDLTGCSLHLIDETGRQRAELRLSGFDGDASHGSVEIAAPDTPGTYQWSARLDAEATGQGEAAEIFDLAVSVRAHRMDMTAWNAPPAIAGGGRFQMNVGLRCSSGCDLSGREVRIEDANGHALGTAQTGLTPRAGTDALYWAEVTLDAPEAIGRHEWRAVANGDDLPCAHANGATPFAINTVPKGEHRLRVEVRDAETSAPIPGAQVVVHPFRARTDEHGLAEMLLPPGPCNLVVSGPDHFPAQLEGDMKDDMVIEVVLDRDIPLSEADIWT